MLRYLPILLALLSSALGFKQGPESALGIAGLNLVALILIYRPHWITFWMPLGFWEQRASDSHKAGQMGPVVAFIGWILLGGLLLLAFSLQ
ncbi:MAG: hypothetical protein AB8B96_12110 [Lysobacterales bacterium]